MPYAINKSDIEKFILNSALVLDFPDYVFNIGWATVVDSIRILS